MASTPKGYLPARKMLKGAADNRAYLPPIGDQEYLGSCVHWAGSYYTKTANMKRNDPSINVNASSNQCSPKFTYNLTNAGEDSGGYGHEPFEIFMRYGVASLSQLPYDSNYTTLPDTDDFIEGLHRRSTNYVWLWDWNPDASQITALKAWLDDGRVAACGVCADDSFDAWGPGDSPWVGDTGITIDDINHMVTVCGYGTGYYLVANQWGTSFGSNGYIVVDSDYFENYFSDVIYPLEGTYEPATDYAKLTINHTQRSDIRELLITANGANVWSNSPLPKDMPVGDPSGAFVTDTRDNLELAIDLTQVSWGGPANVVTARCKDAVSSYNGTVTVFNVVYDGEEYVSESVPVPITYNTDAFAWVNLTPSTDTNVSFTAAAASVSEGSGTYVVTVRKTQPSGNVSGQVVLSGTATEGAGADYTISTTNFTLNAATTSVTFTVTINDDEDEEGAETVILTLANVVGGIPVTPAAFTLTINPSDLTGGSVVISQYTETDSGTVPKGIEIWNASASDLTFDSGANLLDVKVGMNGGAATSVVQVTSGTLVAGDVWVIGTSDMSPDVEEAFQFNGDDAVVVELGGVVQDMIGTAGSDPGSAWTGNGVSTANQNIQLKLGTTFGDPDGWTDPSERFEYVDLGSTLTGFGEPPGGFSDVPPVLASIGNKSVIWSNTLNFAVSATDAVDGDVIVLSASNLPAGAVFATVTNAGTVTNLFSWPNAGPMGVYTTTFWAVDGDGADSETITITVGDGSGPSEIVFQGFEGTAADTWGITAGNSILSDAGASDTPANQRIRTGSYSWQPGQSGEQPETLELEDVDVSSYSDVIVTLHLSATTTDTNDYGMWPNDTMSISLALNGDDYHTDMIIRGNQESGGGIEGVLWGMDATGVAATTAGVTRTMTPATGGILEDGLATVQIAVPDGTASVALKAVSSNYEDYSWNVDDISLEGVNDGGVVDYPPSIAISPDGTTKTILVSNNLNFVITGREIPNDAADTVTLNATGLPAGATFPEVSGSSVLSNSFSWTPTATGTTVVSFFASDKDGTNQLDVTINVFEHLSPGTYRAVICGISDYDGSDNDLSYCDDDAQEMYDRLVSGSNWEAENIQLLIDSQATESNIHAAITAMGAAAAPGDVCLFFFSGHGGGDLPDIDGDEDGDGYDEYFCPYYLYDNEVTDDELSDWLDALPTDNIIVLLDTCFSGGHLKGPVGLRYKGISRTDNIVTDRSNGFMDDLRRTKKTDVDDLVSPYIATACDEEELSAEDDALQNGVFAYYLLEALTNSDANADGWTAGEEAFDYLYAPVVAYNSEQHPQEYDGWPGLANIVTWASLVGQTTASIVNVSSDAFTVNWTAVTGATDYQVQVATDSAFSVESGANLMSNAGFEAGDNTDWDKFEPDYSVVTTDPQEGSYHVSCSATATRDMMQMVDITGDGSTEYEISYYYKVLGGDGSDVRIWSTWAAGGQVSGDNLTNGIYNATTANWTKMTYHVVPASGANTLNFEVRCYNGSVVYLDNFFVGESGTRAASKTLVLDDTVAALTYPVTGLDPETLYYVRVRAAGGTWSDTVSETTLAAGGTPAPEPITDWLAPTNGTAMSMQIQTANGVTYVLQCTSNLWAFPPVWIQVDSESGTGGAVILQDADSDDLMRFYRVVTP